MATPIPKASSSAYEAERLTERVHLLSILIAIRGTTDIKSNGID